MNDDPEKIAIDKLVSDYAGLVNASHAKTADAHRMLDAALVMQPCAEQIKLLDAAEALFKEAGEIDVKSDALYAAAYEALVPHVGAEKMKEFAYAATRSFRMRPSSLPATWALAMGLSTEDSMTVKFETTCDGCGKRCDDKHVSFIISPNGMPEVAYANQHACSMECAAKTLQNMAKKFNASHTSPESPALSAVRGGPVCGQCGVVARYTCGCRRCASEPDDDEKYHTCNLHKTEVGEQHERVRERVADWCPR